jgi:hypothetical protein
VEALAFGALVFIAGTLIVAGAWAVIDAKFTAVGAAREGARTYVESGTSVVEAEPPARGAAKAALTALGRDGDVEVSLDDGGYRRCGRVTVRVTTHVPVVRVPFLRLSGGNVSVVGSATRLIDPLRSGILGQASCVS